jgi:hypothetical protein
MASARITPGRSQNKEVFVTATALFGAFLSMQHAQRKQFLGLMAGAGLIPGGADIQGGMPSVTQLAAQRARSAKASKFRERKTSFEGKEVP